MPEELYQYRSTPEHTERITSEMMHEAARERVDHIAREFKAGFEFLARFPKSVSIFGSSRFAESHPQYKKAEALAARVVRDLGYAVITGGGPGIMAAANKGAYEAGGHSVGLTIQIPSEQTTNLFLTDKLDFYYFFSRKVCLSFAAEAYIFFPGGYGTMDELFEILTLVQTGKIEPIPIILIDGEYWKETDAYIRNTLLARETIRDADADLYTICENEDEIIDIIKSVPVKRGVPLDNHS